MTHKNTLKSVDSLLKIMLALRAPNGCPWDAEQTPESLSPYIIEEACELVDAIESGNRDLILDELGDLLLQVVFQAQIFSERGEFDFHDVANSIADKLLRRHPHVFGEVDPEVPREELDKQWEEIKRSEPTHNKSCLADHLPSRLPSLQKAQKIISKAYKTGRQQELPDCSQIKQLNPEFDVLIEQTDEDEIGRLIYHLLKIAHESGIDAESALRKTTRKLLQHLDTE